jgi:hypothetical protein
MVTVAVWNRVKLKFTLEQATEAERESRGFIDLDTRMEWGVSVTPRLLSNPGKDPVLIVQEAGWAPEPVWTGAENLAPTGTRSPDRSARSQSLYRLATRPPCFIMYNLNIQSVPRSRHTLSQLYKPVS